MSKVSALIKKIRKSHSINQMELGRRLQVSSQFITKIEKDRANYPLDKLNQICNMFKLNKRVIIDMLIAEHREKLERALK